MLDTSTPRTAPTSKEIYDFAFRLAQNPDLHAASYERDFFGNDVCDFIERLAGESRKASWSSTEAVKGYEQRYFSEELRRTVLQAVTDARKAKETECDVPCGTPGFLIETFETEKKKAGSAHPAQNPAALQTQENDETPPPVNNNPFSTSGRIGRLMFFANFIILTFIGGIGSSFLDLNAESPSFVDASLGLIILLCAIYLKVGNWCKRLRDLKKNPWYAALMFVPLVNIVAWFFLLFRSSRYPK
jgi:uncharacterized membrane protein YhaH (DUF805 family)